MIFCHNDIYRHDPDLDDRGKHDAKDKKPNGTDL